ncbi:MAG TPA: SLC13 family permease [Acidimicrobiales bacterium]|nr:SLC13 family permease [Acidimicrobiales bacterium]
MQIRTVGAMRARVGLVGASAVGVVVAMVASPDGTRAAASQTWPPFALVAGLLMIGVVAHRDGLFSALAAATARFRAHPAVLLVALLGVVAAVTAVLNLDTSVAFLTPVLVLAARARGLDEEPFLYGTLLMSNAASLLLPGSNLTNLLVLGHDHVAGGVFAARMLPAWIAAIVVTAVFTVVAYRHRLLANDEAGGNPPGQPVMTVSWSTGAVIVAAAVLLVAPSPALPVLVIGCAVAAIAVGRGSISAGAVGEAVDPLSLAGLFALAVTLGALARGWSGPAHLVAGAGRVETAIVGAVAAVVVSNLPAAVLLASRPPAHPRALLLGLNLGPNLAVTGSLSALIWFRSARAIGARPSAARLTRLGILLVPLTIVVAGVALMLFSPVGL